MDKAIFITTKAVINNLIAELRSNQMGNVSAFFYFTRHKDFIVYVSPRLYSESLIKLLKIDEEAYSQVDSFIEDGGLIIGSADFGSEVKDIIMISKALSVRTTKPIFIIKSKTETIDSEEKPENVGVLDIDTVIELIKTYDGEFRKLCWGN